MEWCTSLRGVGGKPASLGRGAIRALGHGPVAPVAVLGDAPRRPVVPDRVHGRLDISEHPFTVGLGTDDVRITTHFHADNFLAALGVRPGEIKHRIMQKRLARMAD